MISRGEILCQASITPETEIMHAHSWINTYYFTWQHMFLALHHVLYNAIRLAVWRFAVVLFLCVGEQTAARHPSSGLDIYQQQTLGN